MINHTRLFRGLATSLLPGLITLISPVAITGCQHQAEADRALATRCEKLVTTADMLANTERERPPKLQRTLAHTEWYFAHQAERLMANLDGAGKWLQEESRRPRTRIVPGLHHAGKILYGRPENIELNAIELFW